MISNAFDDVVCINEFQVPMNCNLNNKKALKTDKISGLNMKKLAMNDSTTS